MDTPIIDFVKNYNEAKTTRFHMPGHKGVSFLGFEKLDITEIGGADDLSCPEGIIKKSEDELERVKNNGKNSKIKLEAELKEAQENYSRTQKRIEAYKNHSKNGWIICLTIGCRRERG